MSVWTLFLMLGVTALWVGMLGAVAYLAGPIAARRPAEAAPVEAAGSLE